MLNKGSENLIKNMYKSPIVFEKMYYIIRVNRKKIELC